MSRKIEVKKLLPKRRFKERILMIEEVRAHSNALKDNRKVIVYKNY